MHNVLGNVIDRGKGRISDPTLNRYLKQQLSSIQKIKRYHNNNGKNVNSQHPLVKLIYSFSFPTGGDIENTFERATGTQYELAASVGIVTPVNNQPPHPGVFYPDCSEYLVSVNNLEFIDVLNMEADDWLDMSPVRVAYQPYLVPLYHIPHGGRGNQYHSVITVDIPALAVMFIEWGKTNQIRKDGSRETVEQFIGRYVLPGMLISQQNSVLFNQITNISGSFTSHAIDSNTPVHVTSYDVGINKQMNSLLAQLATKELKPLVFLDNVPGIESETTLFSQLPFLNTTDTQANYEVNISIWLPIVSTVLLLTIGNSYSTSIKNRFKYAKRQMRNRSTLKQIDSPAVKDRLLTDYNLISTLL